MKVPFIRVASNIILIAYITGCASSPDKVSSAYVSPLQYSTYNCNQIKMELMRVSRRVSDISGTQQKTATKDAVALGVGLVIFWPALFFMIGGDKKDELARLKGEYEAIESAAIEKECDIAPELEAAREQREKEEAERKQQQAEQQKAQEWE